MNKVILIGNTTKKPELRITTAGNNMCNFTLAVRRDYKNANGEYEADFVNCTAFGKTAELISEYCEKGDKIAVDGKFQAGLYKDKNGQNQYSVKVIIDKVTFLQKNKPKKVEETVDPFEAFGNEVSIDDDMLD